MKILYIFIPIILLIVACSKKSNTPPAKKIVNLNIVGRWTYTGDTLKYFPNGVHQPDEDNIVPVYYNPYIEFNPDSTGSENLHDPVQDSVYFSYSVRASNVSLNYPSQYTANEQDAARTVPASVAKPTDSTLYIVLKYYYPSGLINSEECISPKKDN